MGDTDMRPIVRSEDERLCDVFEMLIQRIGAVEERVNETNTKLMEVEKVNIRIMNMLVEAARQRDSERDLGSTISGTPWCDRPLKIKLHSTINDNGRFYDMDGDNDLILVDFQVDSEDYVDIAELPIIWATEESWKWDNDVIAEWGRGKFDLVRTNMLRFFSLGGTSLPTSAEVGIGGDCNVMAIDAVYEAALRHRHKGLVAFYDSSIFTSLNNLISVVNLVDAVTQDLGMGLMGRFRVNWIDGQFTGIALKIIRDLPTEGIWDAFSEEQREILREQNDDPDSFFYLLDL